MNLVYEWVVGSKTELFFILTISFNMLRTILLYTFHKLLVRLMDLYLEERLAGMLGLRMRMTVATIHSIGKKQPARKALKIRTTKKWIESEDSTYLYCKISL